MLVTEGETMYTLKEYCRYVNHVRVMQESKALAVVAECCLGEWFVYQAVLWPSETISWGDV